MAAGNIVGGTSSLVASATYDIKPTSPNEWDIHNIYYNNQIKLSMTDGTNVVDFDSDPGETISSRMGKHLAKHDCPFCSFLCKCLNLIQKDHCVKSIEVDEGKDEVF